jgi:V-type H+-transporting ATPase subunit B
MPKEMLNRISPKVIKEYYARKPSKSTKGGAPKEDEEAGKQDKSTRDTSSSAAPKGEGKLVDA